jgi:hypothetical protein
MGLGLLPRADLGYNINIKSAGKPQAEKKPAEKK